MKFDSTALLVGAAAFLGAATPVAAGLRDLGSRLYVGVALDPSRLNIPAYEKIAREEFSSIVAENAMKWESTEKERGVFSFDDADKVVAFAEKNGQMLRGHTFVWHSQLAPWVNAQNWTNAELLSILETHIKAVGGRYKGKIKEWDVTNEIVSDSNGAYRDTIFLKTIGIAGYKEAFKMAHKVDPNALLVMNDYNIEGINAKSDTYYELAKEMLAEGIPLHGIGMQAHYIVGTLPTDIKENIQRFVDLGLMVSITEVDIRIPEPFTADKLAQQSADFATLFNACESVCGCKGVTIWGVDDGHSWVPGVFAGQGSALIYDDNYVAKPSYTGVANALKTDESTCKVQRKKLRDLGNRLYVGVALDPSRLSVPEYEAIAREEFSSIVAENAMKWESTEKERGVFSFDDADKVVAFAEKNGQKLRGHTFVWHSQLAPWVNAQTWTKEELMSILETHITAVGGRYKGKIMEWDVTNEIVSDTNGEFRDTIFLKTIGIEGYKEAFKIAHKVDPSALLVMNDYNIEGINAKSDTYYKLAKEMLAEGIPLHGIGMQAHYIVGTLPTDIKENIQRFVDLGLMVSITEVDVRIPQPFTAEKLAQQAKDYATLINACESVCGCKGVTIWGVDDGHSWVQGVFTGQGSALVFDEYYKAKPAYYGAADALEKDDSPNCEPTSSPVPTSEEPTSPGSESTTCTSEIESPTATETDPGESPIETPEEPCETETETPTPDEDVLGEDELATESVEDYVDSGVDSNVDTEVEGYGDKDSSYLANDEKPDAPSAGLSPPAIAGIAVGSVCAVLAVVGVIVASKRRTVRSAENQA